MSLVRYIRGLHGIYGIPQDIYSSEISAPRGAMHVDEHVPQLGSGLQAQRVGSPVDTLHPHCEKSSSLVIDVLSVNCKDVGRARFHLPVIRIE
jgi:hypothetical protein